MAIMAEKLHADIVGQEIVVRRQLGKYRVGLMIIWRIVRREYGVWHLG